MKKLILAAMLTVAINSGVSAQSKNPNAAPGTNKNNPGFVDNNQNNVCDNFENNTCSFAGKGQGQGRGMRAGLGNQQRGALMPCRRAGGGGRRSS